MAKRTGVMNRLKRLTSDTIDILDVHTLRELVVKGSKLVKQNLRRLKKSKVANLSKLLVINDGEVDFKETSMESANKMNKQQLRKKLNRIVALASAKTSSIRGTNIYVERMKKLGIDVSKLTKSDWETIRRLIEENMAQYSSEEIITAYCEATTESERAQFRRETKQSDWYRQKMDKKRNERERKKFAEREKRNYEKLLELQAIPNDQKNKYQKAQQTKLLKFFGFDKEGNDINAVRSFDDVMESSSDGTDLGTIFNLDDLYNL